MVIKRLWQSPRHHVAWYWRAQPRSAPCWLSCSLGPLGPAAAPSVPQAEVAAFFHAYLGGRLDVVSQRAVEGVAATPARYLQTDVHPTAGSARFARLIREATPRAREPWR